MPITIIRSNELFTAKVTPPDDEWESPEPMDVSNLVKKLLSRGYHQTDIGDALYLLDPKLIGLDKRFSNNEAAETMYKAEQLSLRNINRAKGE